MTRHTLLMLLGVLLPGTAHAQNSIFGTRGLGFPGRPITARALAMGGGSALFDRGSALNPAMAVFFRQVTVGAVSGTTFRNFTAGDTEVSGLQETRFPLVFLAGGIARTRFSFHMSFSTYAERTFDLTTSDTIMAGGSAVPVTDRVISDGGIVDVRGSIGWAPSVGTGLGAAFHMLAGSSRVTASRDFDEGQFARFSVNDALSFSGNGFSVGGVWQAFTGLRLAAAGRVNLSLSRRLGDGSADDIAMPAMLAGGVSVELSSRFGWMTTGKWRSWSRSEAGFAAAGTRAFDTWEVGSGVQLGSGAFPIRLGTRFAQLPFSPNDDQATEWNFSFGTGSPFASGRAAIDVAVLRFQRDGAGARERGWYIAAGITITPAR